MERDYRYEISRIVDDEPCAFPVLIKGKGGKMYHVSCGKCYRCLKKKKMGFVNRLHYEHQAAKSSLWITLTYRDECLTKVMDNQLSVFDEPTHQEYAVLNHRDFQLFMKKVRKECEEKYQAKIRYFMVGEYGPTTFRPHYHCLMFFDKVIFPLDLYNLIDSNWQLGYHVIDTPTPERFNYCAKYCIVPSDLPSFYKQYPPYMRCSKGIGKQFITDEKIQYYRNLITQPKTMFNASFLVRDSVRYSLPRYYKDKIFNVHEKRQIAYASKRNGERVANERTLLIENLFKDIEDARNKGDEARLEDLTESLRLWLRTYNEVIRNREEADRNWRDKQMKKSKI